MEITKTKITKYENGEVVEVRNSLTKRYDTTQIKPKNKRQTMETGKRVKYKKGVAVAANFDYEMVHMNEDKLTAISLYMLTSLLDNQSAEEYRSFMRWLLRMVRYDKVSVVVLNDNLKCEIDWGLGLLTVTGKTELDKRTELVAWYCDLPELKHTCNQDRAGHLDCLRCWQLYGKIVDVYMNTPDE